LTVDGSWFECLEKTLMTAAEKHPQLARIAQTVDDVPTPLMAAYAKLFTAWNEDLDDVDWALFNRAVAAEEKMLVDIERISPRDATEYVSELLRRTGFGVLD
jgi:hypothetical protein